MEQYKVYIKRSAGKELGRIREKDRKKVIEKIRSLSFEPRPVGVKKLSGEEKYRLRQGDYRILYKIEAEIVTVTVVRIAHRREVYR
jgi:mRNA interferase RelE/StbE